MVSFFVGRSSVCGLVLGGRGDPRRLFTIFVDGVGLFE